MLATILRYGIVAGAIVGTLMVAVTVPLIGRIPPALGMAIGYTTMLIALSAVFVAVKRRRDHDLGGVIRFWPAFGLGLGISVVASICYALAWEVALAVNGGPDAFIDSYIAQTRAAGGDPAGIAQLEAMRVSYRNPLFRLPITMTEILPVGLLVSLVSAALLRNPRMLPARRSDPAAG
jgi:hypothetical protein